MNTAGWLLLMLAMMMAFFVGLTMGAVGGNGGTAMHVKIQGKLYQATPAQVVEKDPDGKPRVVRLIYPDESVSTAGEPEFLVGFFQASSLQPSPEQHN